MLWLTFWIDCQSSDSNSSAELSALVQRQHETLKQAQLAIFKREFTQEQIEGMTDKQRRIYDTRLKKYLRKYPL